MRAPEEGTEAAGLKPRQQGGAESRARVLDEAVLRLREAAPAWARASLPDRIAIARSMLRGVERTAARGVAAACAAKGLPADGPLAGEEWLGGPWVTARFLRQLVESLGALARSGNTPVGRTGETVDGRLSVRVFPASKLDAALFLGVHAEVHLEEGVGERELHEARARFHKRPDHDGKVVLVLGAGNVNSIPCTDAATKLFNEGKVCLLKMSPVNAYLGPLLEEAFAEPIARGFLAVVYGGADEGAYLAHHPGVDEVHVTGSERTHDAIVWGPPGPERAARIARDEPLLAKEITSELGNVSPVLVVPGPWDARTLRFQAESVAGMVTYNAGYNCVSARVLVTPGGWRHREAFLAGVDRALALVPARRAYYPGSAERYRELVSGRASVRRAATAAQGVIPWTLVEGLDASAADPAFASEFFCGALCETSIAGEDPVEYLEKAVDFANERLWGTLTAHLVVHPRTLADRTLRAAVDRAIRRLRYGTVTVNSWAAWAFAAGTVPWGAFPGSTLRDVQSGRGFVHNTRMLERVEKSVVWHPATHFLKPPFFPSHRTTHELGKGLVDLEARGSLLAVPRLLAAAARA